MKFEEIISRYTWQEVEPVYLELYSKEKRKRKKVREAFEYIKTLKPASSGMRIHIEYREDEDGGYHHVLGRDGSLGRNGQEESYGIFLVDWDEWLGMEIEADTLEKYSDLDILCHCFWEMTWCGYSMEKVEKFREELKLAEADTEFIPLEQVFPQDGA
ncbi:MAG: DUF6557 family protein [Thermodesulfobacteriota bacterium]